MAGYITAQEGKTSSDFDGLSKKKKIFLGEPKNNYIHVQGLFLRQNEDVLMWILFR